MASGLLCKHCNPQMFAVITTKEEAKSAVIKHANETKHPGPFQMLNLRGMIG